MNSLARTARRLFPLLALGIVLGLPSAAPAQTPDLAGSVGFELRGFPNEAVSGLAAEATASVVLRPELEWEWYDGDQRLRFLPFFRFDETDERRTHFDLRELIWTVLGDSWEVAGGIGHVFWGVTESQHLVDIINQTDLVENLDGEDKLGQPMLHVTLLRDWGAVDVFVLPGFRERTFPGSAGRFRPPAPIDTERAFYASGAGRGHVDFAVRWSHYFGDWDVGVAHFHGTGREPTLVPASIGARLEAGDVALAEVRGATPAGDGRAPAGAGRGTVEDEALVPFYSIIDQTSLDLTGAKDDVLWKLELIHRAGQGDRYVAVTGGLEYTLVGAFGRSWDVGLLAEYSWDERGKAALGPFDDDLFLGLRLALNDVQSTDLLAGMIIDRHSGSSLLNVEMQRRIGERYRLEIEGRFFLGAGPADRLFLFQGDDYVSLELSRYF